jgi:hypothetical protein
MANPILAFPNHLDNEYYYVVVGGGAWTSTLPLTNILEEALSQPARSSGVADADLQMHFDIGAAAPCLVFAIPFHDFSLSAERRLRACSAAAWAGVTVNSSAIVTATSVSVAAGAAGAEFAVGQVLTFAGDETVYKITAGLSLGASGTGSLAITPALASALAGGEDITCHSGDLSAVVYDSGRIAVFPTIYPSGTLPYGHRSWWSGTIDEEQRLSEKIPIIDTFGGMQINARYWYLEFFDSTNAQGYVEIPRVFLAPGYQPTVGIDYGAQTSYVTRTRVETALSGRRIYDAKSPARRVSFNLGTVPTAEGIVNIHEAAIRQGIHKQLFFVFDPDDVELLYRRSFLATMEEMPGYNYPYFNRINAPFTLLEVL